MVVVFFPGLDDVWFLWEANRVRPDLGVVVVLVVPRPVFGFVVVLVVPRPVIGVVVVLVVP